MSDVIVGLVEFHEHPRGCAQPNVEAATIDAFAIITVGPGDHGGAIIEYERGNHSSYYYSVETAPEIQRRWRVALGLLPPEPGSVPAVDSAIEQERGRQIVAGLPPPGPEYYLLGDDPPPVPFPEDDLSLAEDPPQPTKAVFTIRLPFGRCL